MLRRIALIGLLALTACASPARDAERALEEGRAGDAIATLEAWRDREPDAFDARMALARAHYQLARAALEKEKQETYASHLAESLREVVEAARIDPRSPEPHTLMGIIAAYRGDLDASLSSFQNANRLGPRSPISLTNLAEVHIYRGEPAAARMRLDRARKMGAPRAVVELNEVLAGWRRGDYVEARDLFDTAYGLDPQIVRVWNDAPVEDPIETFEDLTAFCCSHIACGPYMANACRDMDRQVAERKISEDTLAEEMRIERERLRRLREIYDKERGLDITIEPDPPAEPEE